MINIKISYSLSARSTDTVSWICVFSFYYVAALNGRVSNNCDNTTDTICKYGWSIRFTNEQWIDKQAFVHHWPSHCSYFYCSSGLNFSYMNWHWRIVLKCHCTYTHLLSAFFSDQSAISVFVSCTKKYDPSHLSSQFYQSCLVTGEHAADICGQIPLIANLMSTFCLSEAF